MNNQLKNITAYLANPYFVEERNKIEERAYLRFLYTYLWCLVGFFIAAVLIIIVSSLIKSIGSYDLLFELRSHKFKLNQSKSITFLIMVIVGPILEELIFRLSLVPNRINISVTIALLFYLYLVPDFGDSFGFSLFLSNVFEVGLTIFCFGLIFKYLPSWVLENLKYKYFKYLFFFSVFSFGFVHLLNYKPLTYQFILLSPLIVLPQLIYGLLFSYTRVNLKYGFLYSLLLHMMINFPSSFLG